MLIAIEAVLQTTGCTARGEVGAGGVAGPHAGPQPEYGADPDPSDGMHVGLSVAHVLGSCANICGLTGCAAVQLRRVFLTQLGELVRRRQALAHLLQVQTSNAVDESALRSALWPVSIACHAHPSVFGVRQEGVNASSRYLASSQIVQNVKAIEDMRELLMQEHSLTIKVCLCCTTTPCSAAECFQPWPAIAQSTFCDVVHHHSLASRAGPVPGCSPACAGVFVFSM